MANTIQIKRKTNAGAPSSLADGELALNTTDDKLYIGNSGVSEIDYLNKAGGTLTGSLTTNGDIIINKGNGTLRLNDTTNGSDFVIFSNSSELRMAVNGGSFPSAYLNLTTGGNLGLGVTGASERLEVAGNAIASGYVRSENITYAADQDVAYLIAGTSGWTGATTNWNTYGFQHRIKTNSGGVPRVTIDRAGGEAFSVDNSSNVAVGNNLTVGGTLEVGNDGNTDYALIGPTKIGGGFGHGDYAGFSHRDRSTTTSYALLQHTAGTTYLNSNVRIYMGVNNANYTAQVESDRFQVNNALKLNDNSKIKLGDSDDLQIYHNGSDSIIADSGTGGIKIDSNYTAIRSANGSETAAKFLENGAVELYHDNSKKFETIYAGAKINGLLRTVSSTYSGIECQNTDGVWESFIGTESGGGGNRYNAKSSVHKFYLNSTLGLTFDSTGLTPSGSKTLGSNASRWSTIYGVAGNFSGHVTLAGDATGILYFGSKRALEGQISNNNLDLGEHFANIRMRSSADVFPTNSVNLGTSSNRWATIYGSAGDFSGDLNIHGSVSSGSVTHRTINFNTSESSAGLDGTNKHTIGEIAFSGKDGSFNAAGKYAHIKSYIIDVNSVIQGSQNEGGQLEFTILRHDVSTEARVEHTALTIDNNADVSVDNNLTVGGHTDGQSSSTISASSKIDVADITTGAFRFYSTAGFRGGLGTDRWASGISGTEVDLALYVDGDNDFNIWTNNVKRATFNSTGLGIGTASPNYTLQVVGTFRASDSGYFAKTSGTGLTVDHGTSFGTIASDIHYFKGNVGIGDTSPAGLLSLAKGTRTLDIKLETSPASGDMGVQFRAGSGDYLGLAAGGGTGTGIVIDDSNRVGIGTTAPNAVNKLEVNGQARATSAIFGNSATSNPADKPVHIKYGGPATIRLEDSTSSNRVYDITCDHGSGLHIYEGTGSSTPRLSIAETTGYVQVHQLLGVGTASPSSKVHIVDNSNATTGLKIDNTNTGTSARNGVVLLNDSGSKAAMYLPSTNYTGVSGWANHLVFSTDSNISGGILMRPATGGFQVSTSGVNNNDFVVTSAGRCGIGTTTPSRPLHVYGGGTNFVAEFESTDDKASILLRDDTTLTYAHSHNGYLSLGGQSSLNANNLNINSSTGHVGIGTTSPSTTLHVNKTGVGDNVIAEVLRLSTLNSASPSWSTTDGLCIGAEMKKANGTTITKQPIKFRYDGGDMATTFEEGKVGIGTNSPGYLLDLYGTFGASAGAALRLRSSANDDLGIIWEQANGNQWFVGPETSKPNDFEFWSYNGSAWANVLHLNQDGKVGIGTTSPSAKLHVAGDILRSGTYYNGWVSKSINTLTSGGSTINYILIALKTTINVRLSGRFKCARGNGVSAVSVAHADVVFCTDNDANPQSGGIHSAASDIPSYGHPKFEIVELTYNSADYYALKISPSVSWVASFNHIEFEGVANNVTWTNVGTSDVSSVAAFQGSKAVFAYNHANVGIGTTSPEGLLSFKADESDTPKIRFQNQHSDNADAAISTYDDTSGTTVLIGSNLYINSSGSTTRFNTGEESAGFRADRGGLLQFYTGGTGATASERIRVAADGSVGIGTTSPALPLHVSHTGFGQLRLTRDSTDDRHWDFLVATNGYLSIRPNNTINTSNEYVTIRDSGNNEKIRLATADDSFFMGGNVGINTSSPSAKLHVNGDSYFSSDMGIGMMASSTYRLSVSDTNNTPLQLQSTSNSLNLTLGSATQTSYTNILFNSSSGNAQIWKNGGSNSDYGGTGSLNLYCSNGAIAFHPGANQNEVVIHSDGDVDIAENLGVGGTHSGSYKLYVNGTSYFSDDISLGGYDTSRSEKLKFHDTGGEEWYVEYNDGLRFVETGNAERFKLLDGGNIDTPDQDKYARFGRARVGYIGHLDYAGFAHRDQSSTTNYALLQSSSGTTYLNSASGYSILFRQANANVGGIVSGNWGLGTISPGSYKLYVNGTSYFSGAAEFDGGIKDKDGGLGTNGHVLHTNGSDVYWAAASSSGSGTVSSSTTTSSTTDGEVAIYTASTTVKQAAKLYYNGSEDSLTIGQTSSASGASSDNPLYVNGGVRASTFMDKGSTTYWMKPAGDANSVSAQVAGGIFCYGTYNDVSAPSGFAGIHAKYVSSYVRLFAADGIHNTQISPHNEDGDWEFNSTDTRTKKRTRINMTKLIRKIEELTGEEFIMEDFVE